MKTLITGASGFLGSTIINDYRIFFGDVVAMSRSQRSFDNRFVKSYAIDICDTNVTSLIQENAPNAIIHTAARSIVQDCERNPAQAFMVNVQGTVNVLEAARRMGTDIPVVVLETDKVYGQQPPENIPTSEEHPLLGNSPYESSKVMTAQVCEFYRSYYGMRIYSLRPANIYGYWDTNKSRIIPNTFTKLINNESPVIYSDSKDQLREYVYVDDLVLAIASIIRKEPNVEPGAFNVSSGIVKSPEQVINIIKETMGSSIETTIIEKPFAFNEINNQALTGDKLINALKINETDRLKFTPMETAIQDMWEKIKNRGYGV